MFEFHGWATIRIYDDDDSDLQVVGGRKDQAIKRVRALINEAHDEMSIFQVSRAGNGLIVLIAHGLRNHRYRPVIELFRQVGAEFPHSYGLLYVQDDERPDPEMDEFRVWRLARGGLTEQKDPFLSPFVSPPGRPWAHCEPPE